MAGCSLRELPTGNYQLAMADSWQFAPPIGSKDEHLCTVVCIHTPDNMWLTKELVMGGVGWQFHIYLNGVKGGRWEEGRGQQKGSAECRQLHLYLIIGNTRGHPSQIGSTHQPAAGTPQLSCSLGNNNDNEEGSNSNTSNFEVCSIWLRKGNNKRNILAS
jgi:hypothetical protein